MGKFLTAIIHCWSLLQQTLNGVTFGLLV